MCCYSARSYLLNAEAERDALFALPPPYRKPSMHRRIALEHGIKFPAHHSLSQPPLSYFDLHLSIYKPDNENNEDSQTQPRTNIDSLRYYGDMHNY
jgi:hypothetical protein